MNAPHFAMTLRSNALLTAMVTCLAILIVVSTPLVAITIAHATLVVPPDVMTARRPSASVTILKLILSISLALSTSTTSTLIVLLDVLKATTLAFQHAHATSTSTS